MKTVASNYAARPERHPRVFILVGTEADETGSFWRHGLRAVVRIKVNHTFTLPPLGYCRPELRPVTIVLNCGVGK